MYGSGSDVDKEDVVGDKIPLIVQSSLNTLCPSAFAFRVSRRRSISVKQRRRPPNLSLSTRFSSWRYSITST